MIRPRATALLVALAIAAALSACGHKDQPTSTGSGTPPAPTSPTGPTTPTEPPTTPGPTPQACTYAASADPDDFERDGGNGTLTIATTAGCKWTIKSDAAWAAIEGPTEGDGPTTLKVFAQMNEDASARRMTLAVADQSVVISQLGQGDCTFQVSPVTSSIPGAKWTADIGVVTSRGCRWTAASQASWIRLNSSGATGSGTLTYSADPNPDTAPRRTGVIAIRWLAPTAGQNARVEQAGCSAGAGPSAGGVPSNATFAPDRAGGAITVDAAGGRLHFYVLTDPVFAGCPWSVESGDTWIAFESPGLHQAMTHEADMYFTVPANPSSQPRRGAFVIDGRTTTIAQSGR